MSATELLGIGVGKLAAISELRIALNHEPQYSQLTTLQAGAQRVAEPRQDPPPSSPGEERCRCAPQESAGFEDSKTGCVPETETPGHKLGEHGVQTETGATAFP